MTSSAQQLTYSSVLSQDFVTSNGIVIDTKKTGQVAVFRNPRKANAIEALVISDQGGKAQQLFYLAQDSTTLTGWSLTPLVDSGGNPQFAVEVLAFTTTWGSVDAFFIGTGGHLMHTWADPSKQGGWIPPVQISTAPTNLSQLRVAFSPGSTTSSGTLVVYAIDPKGTVFLNYADAGRWTTATMGIGGATSSWALALTDTTHWFLSLIASETFIFRPGGGQPLGGVHAGWILWASGTMSNSGLSVSGGGTNNGSQLADRVLFNATNMEGTSSTMMVLLDASKDKSGAHPASWLINPGVSGQAYGLIAGTSFTDGAVVESSDGYANLYGIDALMNLYVLRQVTFNAGDMATGYGTSQTWGPVFQLDTQIARIYPDPTPSDAPALMAADAEVGALHLYYQDPTTALWLAMPITLPTTTQLEIDRWRTEISVYDTSGQPMAGVEVAVAAASAIDIEVNGQYFVIDSTTSHTVTTNGLGIATFASLANSLAPPALTLTATGVAPTTLSPGSPVNDYLAGTGTLFAKPTFDTDVVKHLAGKDSKVDPATALQAIQQSAMLGQAAMGQPKALAAIAGHLAANTPVHVYTKTQGHRAFATRAEADAFAKDAVGASSFWGDVWDDAKGFAGDVWHAIKEGLHQVEQVLVDLGQKAVQIWITVEGALVKLADWVIESVEDALHAITSVFNWIEAEVEKVIDFLKALFDFKAIWNTKTFLITQLTALPTFLGQQFTTWSNDFQSGFFAKNKAKIDGFFDSLISKYSGQQFSQLQGWTNAGAPPSTSSPQIGQATPSDLGNNPSGNWFQDKLVSNAPASFGTMPTSQNTPLDNFMHAIVDAGQDLLNAFSTFFLGIQELLDVNNLSSFQNIAISTFLGIAKSLVDTMIDLADALMQGLLALGSLAMSGFSALLATKLELGFINSVYAWVAGMAGGSTALTLGDLICLLLAFPVTVVWKLIAGVDSQPFPNGHPPSASAQQVEGAPAASPTILQVFGTTAGVLTVIGGLWTFASDAMQEPPSWFNYVGYGIKAVKLIVTHPGFLDWQPLQWTTAAVIAANLLWLGPVLYWTVGSSIQTAVTSLQGKVLGWLKDAGLTTWGFSDVTKVASSMAGVFTLGASVYAIAQGTTKPLEATGAIVEGVNGPFAFLTMKPVEAIPVLGEIALPLKLVLDIATSLGGGVLDVVSVWT